MSENVKSTTADSVTEESPLLPPVDVIEDAGGITLYADLPGVPKDRLQVHVEGDTLTIAGEIRLDTAKDLAASHSEVVLSRYRRVFSLSKELDTERVDAEFDKGVLRLRIPKAAHVQPRRIEIRVD